MGRTAMFSTDRLRRGSFAAALAACAVGLSGCIYPQEPLSADFGRALHEDLVAQLANPEPAYGPSPPADGVRTGLAMERYQAGRVIRPVPATASTIGVATSGPDSQQ